MTQPQFPSTEPAAQTLTLLESRLRRLEYLVSGHASLSPTTTISDTTPPSPAQKQQAVSQRLSNLEHDLQTLAKKSPLVNEVLQLHSTHPSLFHPLPPTSVPSTLSDENLASIILSCSSSFPETASRLQSLKDLPIPAASESEKLIRLRPRLEEVMQRQEELGREVAELRERSARVLRRYGNGVVVGMGEVLGEWAERVQEMERKVRRTERAREEEFV